MSIKSVLVLVALLVLTPSTVVVKVASSFALTPPGCFCYYSPSSTSRTTSCYFYNNNRYHHPSSSKSSRFGLSSSSASCLSKTTKQHFSSSNSDQQHNLPPLRATTSSSTTDQEEKEQEGIINDNDDDENELLLEIRLSRQLQQYGILIGGSLVIVSMFLLGVINHVINFWTTLLYLPPTLILTFLIGTIALLVESNKRLGNNDVVQNDTSVDTITSNTFETILELTRSSESTKNGGRPTELPMDDTCFEVKESNIPNAGLGLFATCDIPKGQYFMNYEGEMINEQEYFSNERYPNGDSKYVAEIPSFSISNCNILEYLQYISWFYLVNQINGEKKNNDYNEPIYIDAIDPNKSNLARYMNSLPLLQTSLVSNDDDTNKHANVIWKKQRKINIEFDTTRQIDGNMKVNVTIDACMKFYTCRNIQEGDELCYDYGSQYWDVYNEKEE